VTEVKIVQFGHEYLVREAGTFYEPDDHTLIDADADAVNRAIGANDPVVRRPREWLTRPWL
jgi:hypothetical protein